MNVLTIQRNARVGGGNTYLRALTPELLRRGHEMHLMVGAGPYRAVLREAFDAPLVSNPPVEWLSKRRASRIIRARGIDVVDAHTPRTGRVALAACRGTGAPTVLHVHSLIPLNEAAEALREVARVVVMNRSVRDWVAQVDGVAEKTILSVLPVDLDRFHPRPLPEREGFRIVYCGRLARRKAAYALSILDVFGRLAEEIPGVTLAIVGGRSHRRQVAEAAARVNADLGRHAVTAPGQLLDPSPLIASADLVIGAGYVALEALACGRHTIGVGIQGLTGLVTPENLEACVDANFGDHAAPERGVTSEALAESITQGHRAWRENPSAEWGPEVIRSRFSPHRVADDIERAFAEAVAGC